MGNVGHGRATHVQQEGTWASFAASFQLCCKPKTALKTIKSWEKEKKKMTGEPVCPRDNIAELQEERKMSPNGA